MRPPILVRARDVLEFLGHAGVREPGQVARKRKRLCTAYIERSLKPGNIPLCRLYGAGAEIIHMSHIYRRVILADERGLLLQALDVPSISEPFEEV